jgi:hypothetical protein
MVPRGFKIGETWVALAHRKAISGYGNKPDEIVYKPGIFHVFCPSRIEYVVKDDDSDDKLEKLEKRGISLVRVEKEQTEIKEVV